MATYLSYLRLPFALTTSLAASLSGILYWKQNDLIYPRNVPLDSRTEVPRPAGFPEYEFDDSSEELFITTPDGEKLSAFLLKPKWRKDLDYDSHKTTVMMFHGNAGNIGHRIPVAGCLQLAVPCNIFMLEYRGYGLSTGTPHEKGINVDAQTALDYLRQRKDLAGGNIVLYGQSLGGAVAVQLASQNLHVGDIKAIILENTFTSMRKLIPTAFPPAKYLSHLCHQIWNSEEILPTIRDVPMLFLSGGQDEIIPPSHMQRLHAVARAPIKKIKIFPEGYHNTTVTCAGYFEAIEDFLLTQGVLN